MKKYFVLFLVLVLIISFDISCMSDAERHREATSIVDKPIDISSFQSECVFVAVKDSEQITGMSIGRVFVERLENSDYFYAVFSAFVIPYKNIQKGTHLKLKRMSYMRDSHKTQNDLLIVE